MASIDELIQREINPFDRVNLKPGNFWHSQPQTSSTVDSIHQEAVDQIEQYLDLVAQDHVSRSLLLIGDSGSGKSFLLDRLKRKFNDKAFFAYIGPWADSAYIWRHTLRYTVDSLMQVPIGHQESQLMQWLKGLSAFTKRSLKQRIFDDSVWGLLQNDRQKFIKHLKKTYKTANIHSPDIFFGLLHDLTNPELYPLACEWLRGDDLSDESMQLLRVKSCVDSEEEAKTILTNISKIATETQPIVLCFDQLDNIPETNGAQDFKPLFNVNTSLHNDGLKNFLVIISIITNTWRYQSDRIKAADRARFERAITLKPINLEQAQGLWIEQLKLLHQQATPRPASPIFPLEAANLEAAFPGGKTFPRSVIAVGHKIYQNYKLDRFRPPETVSGVKPTKVKPVSRTVTSNAESSAATVGSPHPPTVSSADQQLQAEFKLEWERELRKVVAKILKPTARSAPELIQMMQETLNALQVSEVKLKLLSGKYASYSLQYKHPQTQAVIGLIWAEDASGQSFFHVMNGCQKVIGSHCQTLQLLRTANVGEPKSAANKIYRQLFSHTEHQHFKPNLKSIHAIATYHSLVNAAAARELVLAGKTITLEALAQLARETQVLQQCQLLQDLGILAATPPVPTESPVDPTAPLRDYIMNLMTTQQIMGLVALVTAAQNQFVDQDQTVIDRVIEQLCSANHLSIMNPKDKPPKRMIYWQPNTP